MFRLIRIGLSGKTLKVVGVEQSGEVIAKNGHLLPAWACFFNACNTPLLDKGILLTSGHHGKTCTLSYKPRMVLSEASLVSVLTGIDQGHLIVVDEVIEELSEELGEPPHAHKIPASRIVFPFPAGFLAFITLLRVVFAVETRDTLSDFFSDLAINRQRVVFAEGRNHERLVLHHFH